MRPEPNLLLLCAAWIAVVGCGAISDAGGELRGAYLGQAPPGSTPEVFAPGVVSTRANELNAAFTPDGNELYFTRKLFDRNTLMMSRRVEGVWSAPEVAAFSGAFADVDPFITRDGRRLYFSSKRPLDGGDASKDSDLWYLERQADGAWGPAKHLEELATEDRDDYYTSLADDGTLYSSIFEPGAGGDIYRAAFDGESFSGRERIGPPISTEASEHDPFIAPDGSYLIFTSDRAGGYGRGDLYISFARPEGGWGEPVNMGEVINSAGYDYCAMLSPDGRHLFFTRDGEVYWVAAEVIGSLRSAAGSPSGEQGDELVGR